MFLNQLSASSHKYIQDWIAILALSLTVENFKMFSEKDKV